jgi:hypothetical protein
VQVIYAAPFILLSLIAFVCCLAIRRLRRYALQALVVPVAFGFCSIVGMLFTVLTADLLHDRFGLPVNPGPLVGIKGVVISFFIYFIPGVVGAWLAVLLIHRIKQRLRPSS